MTSETTSSNPGSNLVKSQLIASMTSVIAMAALVIPLTNRAFAQSTHSIEVRSRQELVDAVNDAKAGTQILIAPGEYRGGLSFRDLQGLPKKPIILAALDPDHPPEIVGGGSCIQLSRPAHVELRDLVIREANGNGINIDDGGALTRPAIHVVLRNLQIRDIGPKGNRDGIKLSGLDHFSIIDCIVERWGSSGSAIDMVGCHEGLIQGCRFAYRGDLAANGVQTKGGSSEITIRKCRFEEAGGRAVNLGGSTGKDYFRPPNASYEARDIVVEDCTFVGSMAPIVFVGVDGATVRYNTIYRPGRWVMRILQESDAPEFIACRGGRVTNNLIVFRSDELSTVVNVGSGTAPETFTFQQNHWYCIDDPRRSDRLGLPTGEVDGIYGVDPLFIGRESGNLRLRADTPVRNAGVRN